MGPTISAVVQWIDPAVGGRHSPAFEGYRLTIRWQRHLKEFLAGAFGVQIVHLCVPTDGRPGGITFRYLVGTDPNPEWTMAGELFELLEGDRVVGVGMVVAVAAE